MRKYAYKSMKKYMAFVLAVIMLLQIPLTHVPLDVWADGVNTTTVSGAVSWEGASEETIAGSVTVKLLQNDVEISSIDVTAENGWVFSFSDLAVNDAEGNSYVYSVQEEEVAGYTISYDGYNITNTSIEEEPDDTSNGKDTSVDKNPGNDSAEDGIAVIDESGDAVGTDNWELGVVFYDSTVNNGNTPLTSINWDASDGSYKSGKSNNFVVQINYKNTNVSKDYGIGELSINIDGLLKNAPYLEYGNNAYKVLEEFTVEWEIGANDENHTGYDWNYTANYLLNGNNTNINLEEITFTNANVIEKDTNFEGSIQILYTITPRAEDDPYGLSYANRAPNLDIEKWEDTCVNSYSNVLQASLNDYVYSDEVTFNYTRTYIHPWVKIPYTLEKRASKIKTYDLLPANAEGYTWVEYTFWINSDEYPCRSQGYFDGYPYIPLKYDYLIKDTFDDACIVVDGDTYQQLSPMNGVYEISSTYSGDGVYMTGEGYWHSYKKIVVGYPKTKFNDELGNMNITNTAELWAYYDNGTEYEYQDTAQVSLNLSDFEFVYSGNLYGIRKDTYSNQLRYQDIIWNGSYNNPEWDIYTSAIYTGNPMTVKIGDDLLYATDINGDCTKLKDDEYYFNYVTFPVLKNGNNVNIATDKYDCELWVRYAGNTEYSLLTEFKTSADRYQQWNFSEADKVVGYYFVIQDMSESIGDIAYGNCFENGIKFIKQNIPNEGRLHNLCYIQVYFKDDEGDLVLQNEPSVDSYANDFTKDNIAEFDKNTYGTYMQRSSDFTGWNYYDAHLGCYIKAFKNFVDSKFVQNIANERFDGVAVISTDVYGKGLKYTEYYEDAIKGHPEDMLYGFVMYDLLPKGMDVTSTEKEILESFYFENYGNLQFYDKNLDRLELAYIEEIVKASSVVTFETNWRDTGRTRIKIQADFKDTPFYVSGEENVRQYISFDYQYKFKISYDSVITYGDYYKNYCLVDYTEQPINYNYKNYYNYNTDNGWGTDGDDVADIDGDGSTTDYLSSYNDGLTITSLISTHQDVQISVRTERVNYSTGKIIATPEKEYSYKLRARSGGNSITNLVLINNIEEAYGTNEYWKGEFLGVNTSFAESKGYTVKTYYSENAKEGNLYQTEQRTVTDDNGNIVYNPDGTELKKEVRVTDGNGNAVKSGNWKEYTSSISKEKVKSLAFEILDSVTGKAAVIPANDLVYVEILMKAPVETEAFDGTIVKKAYNNCFTQWNVVDEFDQTVDFITGINSNTVEVSLVDVFEVSGVKTWVGDTEADRPDSITLNLLQDGEVYKTTTIDSSTDWKYSFQNVLRCKEDGTEYEYSVQEEVVEGYVTSYGSVANGVAITFNEKCATYNSSDYLYIYYQKDGQWYRSNMYYGSATASTGIAGKTIEIPSTDFYLYWYSNGSSNSAYGFSIDSIEPKEVTTTFGSTGYSLPTTTPTEVSGLTYPETSAHSPYNNSETILWHYTGEFLYDEPTVGVFDVVNTYNLKDIIGTKTWVGDTEADRPDSITINLLQDGAKIASTTTTAEQNWEYSFADVPICRDDNTEYEYSVQEEAVEDYETTYGEPTNGLAVTFNSQFKTESVSYDYVEIYYQLDSNTYKLGRWGGTSLAGQTIDIPTSDFYLYWRTDSSSCGYYGFSIDSIEPKDVKIPSSSTAGTLPSYTAEELTGSNYPDSAFDSNIHGNYGNNVNKVWHYTGEKVVNTEPRVGVFDIYNTYDPQITTIDITGTKNWMGDAEEDRPESITVNLLQDGIKIDSTTTDKSKNWEYSFTDVPILKNDGISYDYSVTEDVVEGYMAKYNKVAVNPKWYQYKSEMNPHGITVTIPSKEFYILSVSLSDALPSFDYILKNTDDADFGTLKETDIESLLEKARITESMDEIKTEMSLSASSSEYANAASIPYEKSMKVLGEEYYYGLYHFVVDADESDYNGVELIFAEKTTRAAYTASFEILIPDSDEYAYNIVNTKETALPLEFTKTDFLTGDAMGNVSFDLYRLNCTSTDASHDHGKAGSTSCWENVSTGTSDADGKVSLEGLEKGNIYGLVETVPSGYALPGSLYWKLGVADDGSIVWATSCDETEFEAFTDRYGWLGYDPDVTVKADGSFEISNIRTMRSVTAVKRIKASDINFANGNPAFLFKLTGTDVTGEARTYYRSVEFTESYVESNTDASGYVTLSAVFDDVVAGSYVLSEEDVSRYEFAGVSNIVNGTANGESVSFDLVTTANGSATYTNKVYESQWFSHNDIVTNHF